MWDKTIWASISAILGGIIGQILNGYNGVSIRYYLILILLLVALFIIITFLGPLRLIFSRSGDIHLKGKWISTWSYIKNDTEVVVKDELYIYQYGRYISGKAESTSITGPHPFRRLNYKLRAKFDSEGFIEGEWRNVDKGRRYRGVFQGHISQGSQKISLQWIGTESGGIRHGSCLWEKSEP